MPFVHKDFLLTTKVAAAPRLAKSSISPEQPGDVRYKDRRLIALYFDLSSMPVEATAILSTSKLPAFSTVAFHSHGPR